jgi:hypothetical protein
LVEVPLIGTGDPAAAQVPPAGQLKCHVDAGLSFIVGSSRQVDCAYMPAGGGVPEHYIGRAVAQVPRTAPLSKRQTRELWLGSGDSTGRCRYSFGKTAQRATLA